MGALQCSGFDFVGARSNLKVTHEVMPTEKSIPDLPSADSPVLRPLQIPVTESHYTQPRDLLSVWRVKGAAVVIFVSVEESVRQHPMANDFHSADDADANHMMSAQGIAVDKRPQLPGNQCRSRNLAGGDEPSGNGH